MHLYPFHVHHQPAVAESLNVQILFLASAAAVAAVVAVKLSVVDDTELYLWVVNDVEVVVDMVATVVAVACKTTFVLMVVVVVVGYYIVHHMVLHCIVWPVLHCCIVADE